MKGGQWSLKYQHLRRYRIGKLIIREVKMIKNEETISEKHPDDPGRSGLWMDHPRFSI
jgi:hypothetical protein